ncbi:hypothetical protein M1P56_32610 [Streptomyces sp. HU2014]|uniref:hypothetical protein n=1 Tax=Streptomyces sp. HU2014 TaxID=2939414 RepID=UPI00200D9235|nr:hypothetical protein [Streptomyces sp. HU2014]UQI48721.1 hypothetical protein M1P56_32610 [Streptomyces sp. HU2014]
MIAATTICTSFDLSEWLKKGKVIAVKLWVGCKDRSAVAASGWILAWWNARLAAESG